MDVGNDVGIVFCIWDVQYNINTITPSHTPVRQQTASNDVVLGE